MAEGAPQFADEAVARFVAHPAPLGDLDVHAMRAGVAERARQRSPGPAMVSVDDVDAGGVPARFYRPAAGPLPTIVYLHGGGWSIGDLASFDRLSRRLAARSGAGVLTVDYRLAPEHPWPASVDDTVGALRWVATRPAALGPVTGVATVAGDSAGGTLAALACIRLRDDGDARPDLQVMVYANTDLTGRSPSMAEKAHGFGLDVDVIRFFNTQWVPDPSRWADPTVSPLYAERLDGLPPALIVTAEHDPLRDQAEAYAARLRQAGVTVELRRESGLIHNFLLLDEMSPACAAAGDRMADDVGRLLRREGSGAGA